MNLSHFSNGLVADKNNFDDDNRPKILSGRCNKQKIIDMYKSMGIEWIGATDLIQQIIANNSL